MSRGRTIHRTLPYPAQIPPQPCTGALTRKRPGAVPTPAYACKAHLASCGGCHRSVMEHVNPPLVVVEGRDITCSEAACVRYLDVRMQAGAVIRRATDQAGGREGGEPEEKGGRGRAEEIGGQRSFERHRRHRRHSRRCERQGSAASAAGIPGHAEPGSNQCTDICVRGAMGLTPPLLHGCVGALIRSWFSVAWDASSTVLPLSQLRFWCQCGPHSNI